MRNDLQEQPKGRIKLARPLRCRRDYQISFVAQVVMMVSAARFTLSATGSTPKRQLTLPIGRQTISKSPVTCALPASATAPRAEAVPVDAGVMPLSTLAFTPILPTTASSSKKRGSSSPVTITMSARHCLLLSKFATSATTSPHGGTRYSPS